MLRYWSQVTWQAVLHVFAYCHLFLKLSHSPNVSIYLSIFHVLSLSSLDSTSQILRCQLITLISFQASKWTHCISNLLCNIYKQRDKTFKCYSLLDQRKEKLTARISFASLRLSKSEPISTSLYRVFRRILLLLNLFPSMFPSAKAWWSCVQAAQIVSMFSSVRAKRVKRHLLIKVKLSSVSNTV